MKTFKELTENLEHFRKQSVKELSSDLHNIHKDAEEILGKKVHKVKIIGSVKSKKRFKEGSDVDVGIYLHKDAKTPHHEHSQKVQNEYIKKPYSFGVVNTVVFDK